MAASEHRDAAQWLPPSEQEEWIELKSQVPMLIFVSFIAFNGLSSVSVRILSLRGKEIKNASNQALLRYGVTAATHAIISLMASLYIFAHRDLRHCGDRAFCHDDLTSRLWTVHAGFALFDFVFWQNNGSVVRLWNEMLLVRDTVWLLQAVMSLMYPCRLSLTLLPFQQLFQAAALVDCVRRFLSIYGAPWHLRFRTYLFFMGAHALQAIGGAVLAAFVFFWIRDHNLWALDLPEGMSTLNKVYGLVWLAGCFILALMYIKWLGAAVEMTSKVVEAANRTADAGAKGKRDGGTGRRQREQQRQRGQQRRR